MLRPTTTIPAALPACDLAVAEIRLWKQEEFHDSESQWQDLLARSTADPLFMSWSWQWLWWSHYAGPLRSQLYLIAGYSADRELVGLAPLHLRRAPHRKPLSAMRLETIGSTWRDAAGAYSEYLDFVVDIRFQGAFLAKVADMVLRHRGWSDLVIANCKRTSVAAQFVRAYFNDACYVREADPMTAQLVPLPQEFASYVSTLQSDVRRKVWNQRARLAESELALVSADQIDSTFEMLNDFLEQRWGRRPFRGTFRDFHLDFARFCSQRGTLRMSTLKVAGRLISVMYDVCIGASEYNILSGFDTTVKGLSPGYLHIGYSMERACLDGVGQFDFMAGDGRSRNYKRDFITRETQLATLQCIRAPLLRWLYRGYDSRLSGSTAD